MPVVPHSKIFPPGSAPSFNRNAIDLNFHRIPDLADWFLRLDDDTMLFSDFKPSEFFRDGKAVVAGANSFRTPMQPKRTPSGVGCAGRSSGGGYDGAMGRSYCLLTEKFGEKQRYYVDHCTCPPLPFSAPSRFCFPVGVLSRRVTIYSFDTMHIYIWWHRNY